MDQTKFHHLEIRVELS